MKVRCTKRLEPDVNNLVSLTSKQQQREMQQMLTAILSYLDQIAGNQNHDHAKTHTTEVRWQGPTMDSYIKLCYYLKGNKITKLEFLCSNDNGRSETHKFIKKLTLKIYSIFIKCLNSFKQILKKLSTTIKYVFKIFIYMLEKPCLKNSPH